ncbi:MAG: hypothetical protein QOE19_3941, partial [Actinomycetota bacterium]|nr:hypothetical protein [Actinomycetota bacterium]
GRQANAAAAKQPGRATSTRKVASPAKAGKKSTAAGARKPTVAATPTTGRAARKRAAS